MAEAVTPARALVPRGEFGPFDALTEECHGLYIRGFAERAIEACERWVVLARAAGDDISCLYFDYIRGLALQELGRHREAQNLAEELLLALGDEADPVWRVKALAMVSNASLPLNDHDRAMEALAEGTWFAPRTQPGSYGHISASLALALALRTAQLFESADEVFASIRGAGGSMVEHFVVQEAALTSAFWGTSLGLVGREEEARAQFVRTAERALHLQRTSAAADRPEMVARGEVIEAYALSRLGHVELAAARARDAASRFQAREELIETHLLHLVLARDLVRTRDYGEARRHLELAAHSADAARRDIWAGAALEAIGEVEIAEHGRHPAIGAWKTLGRRAMDRVWHEREGRFATLRHRLTLRRLTEEAARMGRAAVVDPLTGLGNRRMLAEAVDRAGDTLHVVFLDLDGFKEINDRWSHGIGDLVLQQVADLLRVHCRAQDVLVRYGGDEFVVLCECPVEVAEAIAHRLHAAVRDADWELVAPGLRVSVSVGVAPGGQGEGRVDLSPQTTSGPGPALRSQHGSPQRPHSLQRLTAADRALLAAKRAGRDRVVILAEVGEV